MNIIYVSSMFDEDTYNKLFVKEKKPMHAANKYHNLLCKGLATTNAKVFALSVLPINRENCDSIYIGNTTRDNNGFIHKYMSILNVPVLKNLFLFLQSFFFVLGMGGQSVVIYDVLVVSASLGAIFAAKLTGKKCVGIVTDLPRFMPIAQSKNKLKINEYLLQQADGYIFLTKYMNDTINVKDKPYIVLEGHVDINMSTREHASFEKGNKQIIYAGSLRKIYGIANLCKAFIDNDFSDCELHIYGDGDYVPELLQLVERYPNIIYHGNCQNKVVVDAELEATLLVNPRPGSGEYTKYSFPSKTLEYMVSGTPVLTTHLKGIPPEYDEHLYYFDDESEDGLTKALKEILSKSPTELESKGKAAKEFALSQKNNNIQASRIVDFISKSFTKEK